MIRTSLIAVTAASAVGFEPEVSPAAAAAGFPCVPSMFDSLEVKTLYPT
jgi:hypothetical protein